jgi:hypothetical protein
MSSPNLTRCRYKGGQLSDWANVNAPKGLPYVVATPGMAIGYLWTFPMPSGVNANTKRGGCCWSRRDNSLGLAWPETLEGNNPIGDQMPAW